MPHNNPLAADGWEISVKMQRLLAAAEGERWAALYLCGDSSLKMVDERGNVKLALSPRNFKASFYGNES